MDENFCPVIIEYKRASNENVTNQGLIYLDWLMDHRRDFEWLVLERYGKEEAAKVEWSAPRLICIAGDFTRYDEHAVKQISRNIELIRYRRFGDDLLLLDLVTTTTGTEPARTEQPPREIAPSGTSTSVTKYKTTIEYLAAADPALTDLFVLPGPFSVPSATTCRNAVDGGLNPRLSGAVCRPGRFCQRWPWPAEGSQSGCRC